MACTCLQACPRRPSTGNGVNSVHACRPRGGEGEEERPARLPAAVSEVAPRAPRELGGGVVGGGGVERVKSGLERRVSDTRSGGRVQALGG